jgi:diguanylate cyclase (GGDEF)-like protein
VFAENCYAGYKSKPLPSRIEEGSSVLSHPLKPRNLALYAFAFLCLHAISMAVFRAHVMAATYPFIILAPLLALSCCFRRSRIEPPQARMPWIVLSAGLLLWTTGILLSAWEELFQHISGTVAFLSDFAFFLYGVPILLSISFSIEEQWIPLFVWLDGIQAVLTAYLTYITLFSVIPFTARTIHPIPGSLLMLVYNVENLVLACAATLRLLAQPRQGEEKRFFQILCSFLWIYAVCAAIYNYVSFVTDGHTFVDVMADIPFLFLTAMVLLPAAQKEDDARRAAKKPITLFIDNARPIFYTLALSALGITIIRTHFYIGITAIIVSLVVYGIRTITLQSRYMQSQQALQEARDRLEEMSLKDGLTNVANRRCFDQMLESEWKRAVRTQQPLSLLLIDVDYFKNLNDSYGHRYGDQCLVEIAAALQSILPRSGDLLARYGGEEFAVILPATSINGAKSVAERMREGVRSLNIQNETSLGPFATISIGIAVYEFPQAGSPATLVEASDRALYKAKENGRNRIEYSSMQAAFDAGVAN